jgi:hypothetical protein
MTLKHIATMPDGDVPPVEFAGDENEYGQSLFEEIPEDRTCEQAGIPDEWCTCR